MIANLSKDFLLEALSRAQFLDEHGKLTEFHDHERQRRASAGTLYKRLSRTSLNDDLNRHNDIHTSLTADYSVLDELQPNSSPLAVIKEQKFEIIELCAIYYGEKGKLTYIVSASLFLYGVLWAYASVFANSFSSRSDLCFLGSSENNYIFYLFVFLVCVCPLTCLEMKEQIQVQVILALCRVLMTIFIVFTVIAAFFSENDCFGSDYPQDTSSVPYFQINKLYVILPLAVYASIFHQSIPSLSQPVIEKNKLREIFGTTFFVCGIFYIMIGCVLCLYFGANIETSTNLNWENYNGCVGNGKKTPIWANMISFYVVIFPAFDVLSAFVLNGITLGNSLMSGYFGDEVHKCEKDRKIVILFRLLASVPPLIGAFFVKDLGKITDFVGVLSILIGFVLPALLSVRSSEIMLKYFPTDKTLYSHPLTSRRMAIAVSFFGVFCALFTFINLIIENAQ